MTDLFANLAPPTSKDMTASTSSPASAAGTMPYRCPDTLDLFGQAVAPASHSPPPARDKHLAMNATSGPTGSSLSELADRQESLANRLRRQLDGAGSTLFSLTWVRKATPYGRPYYQLAASARRTSDNGFGSWPTPQTADINLSRGGDEYQQKKLETSPYPNLALTAKLASWATPNSSVPGGTPEQALRRKEGLSCGQSVTTLYHQVQLSWPTPTVDDSKNVTRDSGQYQSLTRIANGMISTGSPAPTEKRGQLNPEFSLWLMGYPPEWASCAPQATPSSRKSRRNS